MLLALPTRLTTGLLRTSPAVIIKPLYSCRSASSGSRWKQRRGRDFYARRAKVEGLMTRAAFKLLEMDSKHQIFKAGQTVVDLGYAPGSWSQVALDRTKPHGRVIGIDLIPAQPPRGVATFQGDFLSPMVQKLVKDFIIDSHKQRPATPLSSSETEDEAEGLERPSYIDMERHVSVEHAQQDGQPQRLVDVVLSDMSAPWGQISGFSVNSLSNPYDRLMNTSGNTFRDHAGSMDLCDAALRFASDTLRPGGHFVCKLYQGAEDKELEKNIRKLFTKVFREKPDSSRSESREMYLIGLRRRRDGTIEDKDLPPGTPAME